MQVQAAGEEFDLHVAVNVGEWSIGLSHTQHHITPVRKPDQNDLTHGLFIF